MPEETKYRHSLVAFFDILGFSQLVAQADSPEKATQTISMLDEALSDSRGKISSGWNYEDDKLSVKMFSDCVCVSVPAKRYNVDAFFQIIGLIQSNFLRRRLLIRGAVAIGNHFENENLIFSKGLVDAYQLESKEAKYPRIIVPEDIRTWVRSNADEEHRIWFNDVYTWYDSVDGSLIIDYLNFMPYHRDDEPGHAGRDLLEHKKFIENAIEQYSSNISILEKYRWMAQYHNSWCLKQYPSMLQLRIDNKLLRVSQ